MNLVNPEYLWYLPLLIGAFVVLTAVAAARRRTLLAKLLGRETCDPEAVRLSPVRRRWRRLLWLGATALLIVGAARPFRTTVPRPETAKGRDFVVLFDVSKSMNAADLAPSRLAHAKFLLRRIVESAPGDRFGLVAFAGNAYLCCPLTSDPVTFNEYVDELSSDLVPRGGTNLELALAAARRAFQAAESGNRAILVFTDGEELQGDAAGFVAELKKARLPLFIVGLGDPVAGAPIPRTEGEGQFVRDAAGKLVTSKLNEAVLSRLARETGGLYVRSTVTAPGTAELTAAMNRLTRAGRTTVAAAVPVEEFPKVLLAAGVLLLLFLLLSERPAEARKTAGALVLALGLTALGAAEPAPAEPPPSPSPRLTVPPEPEARYNLARKLQDAGKPEFAALYEQLVREELTRPDLQSKSFHNLGVGAHRELRKNFSAAQEQLRRQQPDGALQQLGAAEKLAAGAEELYARAAAAGAEHLPDLSGNLSRLARDRDRIARLKKEIEELKKRQQQARQQVKQAQQQQQQQQEKNDPQQKNAQDKQQQQQIQQAQQAGEALQKQAEKLRQQQLAQSAKQAREELKKAAEARRKNDAQAEKRHLEAAQKALGDDEKKPDASPQLQKEKEKGKEKEQKSAPAPRPGEAEKAEKRGAEQLLDLLADEEKARRGELRQRGRARRPPVEKDW